MKRLLKQSLSTPSSPNLGGFFEAGGHPQTPGPDYIGSPLSQRSHKYNLLYVSYIVGAVKYSSNFHGLLRNGWLVFSDHKPILATIAGHPRGTAGDIDNGIGLTERGTRLIISSLDMAGYIKRIKTGRLDYCTMHPPESARVCTRPVHWRLIHNRHILARWVVPMALPVRA